MKTSAIQLASQVSLLRTKGQRDRMWANEQIQKAYRRGKEDGRVEGANWAMQKVITATESLSYEA